MSDQLNHDPQESAPESAKKPRRWPRRAFISLMVLVLLLGGAFWLLGRESTLQQLVQRVASASGGSISVTGVTGSLYHRMHIGQLVYKTKDSTVTAQSIDINWSPLQYFSEGLQISELHVAALTVRSTGKSDEPTTMPASLASPFRLSLSDARLDKLIIASDTGTTVIDNLRFALYGDKTSWHLQDASAGTPFGQAKADLTIAGARPFALKGTASLTQALVATPAAPGTAATPVGQAPTPATLTLQAGGSLALLELKAKGDAGAATGTASLALAPFDPVILRAIDLVARDVDPHGFSAGLPPAKFNLKVNASIAPDQKLAGEFELINQGKAGPLDQDLLPLEVFRGRLGGTLTVSTLDNVLLDLGPAGRFNGGGNVARTAIDGGIDTASFKLHTDRLDLSLLHTAANKTAIGGDIVLASTATKQTLNARLADKGLRLDADATLADALLQLQQLRLVASNGKNSGSINATGQLSLKDQQAFSAKVRTQKFDPSALVPSYPAGDLNIDVNAAGHIAGKPAPAWKVAADFQVKPSKLYGQPLTGAGKLNADPTHISGVDARLAMGQNTATVTGNFGAPGEQLRWKVDARQLAAVSPDLIGAINASGVVTGTMDLPRTSFEADARGLGLASAKRPANDSVIHASGDVAMAGAAKTPELKMTGTVQRLNPAAFGAAQAGAINAAFTADARLSADWRAGLNLTLQPSTLSNAPLSGYARLSANAKDISNADIDLRLGANSLVAKGSFGSAMDKLDWKLDAPQLAALGPQFAGILHANGTLSGTTARPAISLNLDGSKLRAPGQQQVESIRGSATLGSTAAAPAARNGNRAAAATADVPLISDIEITGYESPSIKIAKARLQTAGTRSANTITLAANNSDFDATVRIKGGWANDTWTGAIDALQNKGRFALALVAPAPLRLVAPKDSGVAGLARPEQIALGTTTIKIRDGSVRIDNLEKNGGAWRSKGQASALPVWYLGQLSDAWRDSVRGNMTIGADWGLNLQAGAKNAAPVLAGSFHVFREQGDITIIGADLSQPLGLKTLDARATVNDGALRVELNVDGTRVGQARLDGTAQLRDGRLANDSPFTVTGSANMGSLAWLAPLAGQPGLEIDGILKLALDGSGTIGAPQLTGDINGQKLVVNLPDQGIKLRNGVLQARLTGDQLQLQTLSFEGQQGRAQADGWIRYAGNEATMQLKLTADKLEVLSRPDRLLVLSGQSTLVRDAKHFQLDGKFRADRANIELGDENAPTLSNDVVVLGKGAPAPATKPAQGLPLNIDVEADLGDSFKLKGMGIETELAGAVRVRITDRRPPRVNGSIRVVGGTYAAYGQKLAIDRGVINFTGAYDNPGLNIVAVRRRPEGEQLSETNVEAGVEVRGTALAPSAKLISTPTVPDSDKLSWLVLGHGIENTEGNDMALLSTAAGALFGGKGQGKLASSLGLDELGVGQASGTAAGAATGLQNTVVTVGKRISSRAYLSFEQGAGTATSLVKLKYKLNPRISLQFQTGTNNALDVLYSWAFD
ncbi:UNVERIFIED_ORG: translocation and assembly module TamB [Zoogloea ramigera]|uniref:Translocation/assembly module TamB domain-containing protein n=1 Tax=Duganella zoogloeoides TaxID=75659 RepID=A0ABZ0XW50_9BURK|nr:translocation/assembly module TamB domain-containing protein [Duganella zoogloeoides]WQH03976.1 translocation/assembly module TamB domain-containing protein [Duganella zoogloeoides]